jgi:hypothetical protein
MKTTVVVAELPRRLSAHCAVVIVSAVAIFTSA